MAIFNLLHRLLKPPKHFVCEICFETLPPGKKFRDRKCSHPYCTDCVALYVASSVRDRASKIKCPTPRCGKFLDPLTCRAIVTADVFVRWCDNLRDSALRTLKAVYCPFPDCSIPVVSDCGHLITKATCPHCLRDLCFRCKTEWHPAGTGCDEVTEDEVLLDLLAVRKGWTRCPTCRHGVGRGGGCNLIGCRCGQLFCYVCGRKKPKFYHTCKASDVKQFKSWGVGTSKN